MRETLLAIRDILAEPNNWLKRTYGHSGCYCLMGAVAKATKRPAILLWDHPVTKALQRATGVTKPPHLDYDCALFVWNDATERTHQDVLDLIDKALETAS